MAERRMFAKTIIDSDAFLDMPMSARLLYYDLSMRADDDGFNNSPKKVMRTIGASVDDLNILIARKFIIPFEGGVVVIKHWKIHNYIRKDTYIETKYKEEKALLELDENKAYRVKKDDEFIPVDEPWTQDRIGKDSTVKDNINNILTDSAESIEPNEVQSESFETEFEELWSLYPRKIGKKKALSYYIKARKKDTTFEEVKQGILNYCAEIKKKKTEEKYIKHGSTWFNNQGWNDEYEVIPKEEPKRYGGTYL